MFLASEVYTNVRALCNDMVTSMFTNAVLQPYLNMAMDDLRVRFEQYNIPVTNETRKEITIPAGTSELIFNAVSPAPSLPSNLIEPIALWERTSGMSEDYVPMTRVRFLPPYETETNQLIYWEWAGQKIKFIASNIDEEIRIDYIKNIFSPITDDDDQIDVINTKSFLQYRTAALAARFIGENPDRSNELNQTAALELDAVLSIGIKGGQAIATRRRPFRQSFKTWNSGSF